MHVVVTGREGQIVRSLIERAPVFGHEVLAIGRPELDLANEPAAIVRALQRTAPDLIVSAAAYTAVDRAEDERELAFKINERGAGAVAEAAEKLGAPLIHVSTDYVFDGTKAAPYLESDPTGPTSAYGASKLAGERAVLASNARSAVLRTAWVYSPFGANFVRTMLRLARERDEVSVVADQLGNPTSALDIADGILRIASNLLSNEQVEMTGLFHMTAQGQASWAEFAEAIFAASAADRGPSATVRRITTPDYPTPARRPANSRLDSTKLERTHGVRLPDWRSSLPAVVRRLVSHSMQAKAS